MVVFIDLYQENHHFIVMSFQDAFILAHFFVFIR